MDRKCIFLAVLAMGRFSNPSDGTDCTVWAGQNMSKCTRFINVSGSEWKDTFRATGSGSSLVAYNASAKTYDPHYLIGNYYQYNTATAGTGAAVSTDGVSATSSICPAGWVLPLSGTTNNNTSGSFYNMLSKYNAANSDATSAGIIVQPPLSFVRSGYVYLSNGYASDVGNDGRYWSQISRSSASAYILYFTSSSTIESSSSSYYYNGYPLR